MGDCISGEWQHPSKLHHASRGKFYYLVFKPGFQFIAKQYLANNTDLLNSYCQPAWKEALFSYHVPEFYIEEQTLVKPLVLFIVLSWILDVWVDTAVWELSKSEEYLSILGMSKPLCENRLWKSVTSTFGKLSWNQRHSDNSVLTTDIEIFKLSQRFYSSTKSLHCGGKKKK